jgi:hypothetical protein
LELHTAAHKSLSLVSFPNLCQNIPEGRSFAAGVKPFHSQIADSEKTLWPRAHVAIRFSHPWELEDTLMEYRGQSVKTQQRDIQ